MESHQLAMLLRRAYMNLHRKTNAAVAGDEVTAEQFVLLTLLQEHGPLSQREIVQKAYSDPSTVRAMVVLLQNRGLVSRSVHPSDGRAWLVELTAAGNALQKRLWKATQPVRDYLGESMKPGQAKLLAEILQRWSDPEQSEMGCE